MQFPVPACFSILALFVLASLAAAQETAKKTLPPEWITPITYSTELSDPPDTLSSGTWYLAYSEQINHAADQSYFHCALKVVNQTGVEDASTITVDFNPSFESLSFHRLSVRRAGAEQDRLPTQKIEILRPETDREMLVYSNSLQAHLILDDIRAGDVIEYAYSLSGSNPVLDGHLDASFSTQWSVPLAYQQATVIVDEGVRPIFKSHSQDIEWTARSENGTTRYEWEQRDPELVYEEDSLPYWYSPYGYAEITTFPNWNTVATWGAALYAEGSELSNELKLEARKIGQLDSPREQIVAALRFCQDEIRYTSISIGEHNYKPYPLSTVYERRFGDCKDKSRLLVAILKELGFEAKPALVSTSHGKILDTSAPSPSCFDHVVTKLRFEGETYWLDPTRTNQRGDLDSLFESNNGYALVLDPATENLEWTGGRNLDRSNLSTEERFVELPENQALLTVTTHYEGNESDWMRSRLAASSRADFERLYLNHYANFFPNIELDRPLEIEDREGENRITLREYYRIREFLTQPDETSSELNAYFHASSIQNAYASPSTKIRSMPIGQAHPKHVSHTIKLDFLQDEWSFDPDERVIENEGFRFKFTATPSPKQLVLDYEYRSLADAIAVENAAKYIADVDRLEEYLNYGIMKYGDAEAGDVYYGHIVAGVTALVFSAPMALLCLFLPARLPIASDDLRRFDPLHGLSGWLALVALGLILRPFFAGSYYLDTELLLPWTDWKAFTHESGSLYSPFYRLLFYGEALGQAVLFNLGLAALILFFRKSRLFPKMFVALLAFEVVFTALDAVVVGSIVDVDQTVLGETIAGAIRTVFVSGIWITYALVSKRVKRTFIF